MKNILFIFLFIFLSNCKSIDYYHGYVLDDKYNPVSYVNVKEDNKNPLSTITDSTGYFRLSKTPDLVSKLIFEADGFEIDTIQTVWNRYDGSGKRFLSKIPDTLVLRRVLSRNKNLR